MLNRMAGDVVFQVKKLSTFVYQSLSQQCLTLIYYRVWVVRQVRPASTL